ncbi:MAG: hypothetical protein K2P14_10410 [Anaeroplasmataceae bacterium]|nr:hypothetical protein [Anaeroplasmataceae bacterium]
MPNHVRNVVKFKNLKPDDIDFLLNTIASIVSGGYKEIEYSIDFDKIIPEPQEESECPEDCIVNKDSHIESDKDRPWFDWYKWHIKFWGTKWGPYDSYTRIGKTQLTFIFSTAWSCPYPVIHRLALLGYDIEVRYADEDLGNNCGKQTYTNKEGWTYWDESEIKNPTNFANYIWDRY